MAGFYEGLVYWDLKDSSWVRDVEELDVADLPAGSMRLRVTANDFVVLEVTVVRLSTKDS